MAASAWNLDFELIAKERRNRHRAGRRGGDILHDVELFFDLLSVVPHNAAFSPFNKTALSKGERIVIEFG
jgi:hypothetical protein